MTSKLWDLICPPGSGDGWAASDDGTTTAVPLGVIDHIHSVVRAIDIVDVSLSLVPVMHFCEGDQLDGLALLQDSGSGGQGSAVLGNAPLGGQRDLPQWEIHNGVHHGAFILKEAFSFGFSKELPRAIQSVLRHELKQAVFPHDDQLDEVQQFLLPLAGGTGLVAPP